MNPNTVLPLPKRISWPWDTAAGRAAYWREFSIEKAARAALYTACSSPYRAWLDGVEIQPPVSHLPSWRSMHIIPLELAPGAHRLCFEVDNGGVQQPFLLANLDWEEETGPRRLATDGDWRMAAEPGPGWQDSGTAEGAPAWAFDGVWAEPWGMPCNAPEDFCRLTTGWQTVEKQNLVRVAALHPGLTAAGARV